MAVWVVTGKLGSGKTLIAVSKIREYLNRGCMVATNLDLNMEYLVQPFAKNTRVYRVSDRPSAEELEALPPPYEGDYDEKKAGLMVFDECATWFNSRTWNEAGRKDLINWLLHARKKGWDIIFIIQNVSMMDAQAREGFAEMVVHCRRSDRLSIPFITWTSRMGGFNVRPPKIHWGIVKYGASDSSPFLERWIYTGTDLYKAYDTRQVFTPDSDGLHSVLPPHTIYGRYTNHAEHNRRGFINAFNKLVENSRPRAAFLIGLLLSGLVVGLWPSEPQAQQVEQSKAKAGSVASSGAEPVSLFDTVRITGSVKGTRSFDYIFETDNGAFYPEDMGYRVRWISECRAALVNATETKYVTCSPYRAYETTHPREGVGSDSGEMAATAADITSRVADGLLVSSDTHQTQTP